MNNKKQMKFNQDVENIFNKLGIKLRKSNNRIKSFGEVFNELSVAWDSYNVAQRTAISKVFTTTTY